MNYGASYEIPLNVIKSMNPEPDRTAISLIPISLVMRSVPSVADCTQGTWQRWWMRYEGVCTVHSLYDTNIALISYNKWILSTDIDMYT